MPVRAHLIGKLEIRVRMDGIECVDDRGKPVELLYTNVSKVEKV